MRIRGPYRSAYLSSLFALAATVLSATNSQAAQLLFHSKWESGSTLHAPQDCITSSPYLCWQWISGTDYSVWWTWPPQVWGSQSAYGGGTVFQLISDIQGVTTTTIKDYIFNRIVTVHEHNGNLTNKALYSQISAGPNGQNPIGSSSTQNSLQIFPTSSSQGDLYISTWVRFQPGMLANMTGLDTSTPGIYANGGTWRGFFALKTGSLAPAGDFPGDNGDYRIEAYIATGCNPAWISAQIPPCTGPNPNPAPFWIVVADNSAGGGYPLTNAWQATNTTIAIPDDGSWNRLQFFLHRSSGSDGRFWMAINGQTLIDRYGPNTGAAALPINRIMPTLLYTGGRLPVYQWIDDIEIWDGLP